jgi:hypothetical protein
LVLAGRSKRRACLTFDESHDIRSTHCGHSASADKFGPMSSLRDLEAFLTKLQATNTHFDLSSVREGALMVKIILPGERWEVEFFADREPEVEIFRSGGQVFGPEKFADLWELTKD